MSSAKIDARTIKWARLALALGAATAFGLAYLFLVDFRSEINRAAGILSRGDVELLRDYILSFGAWAPVVSASLMVLQALAAPLPAFLITFANGLAFGAFRGRVPVEALVGKAGLESADRWFARWGAYAVLIARLVPIVSFDVISFAAGLTPMRFWRFLLATVVGAAPATFTYSYLEERGPDYIQALLVAFGVVIGGAVVAAVVRRWRRGKMAP